MVIRRPDILPFTISKKIHTPEEGEGEGEPTQMTPRCPEMTNPRGRPFRSAIRTTCAVYWLSPTIGPGKYVDHAVDMIGTIFHH